MRCGFLSHSRESLTPHCHLTLMTAILVSDSKTTACELWLIRDQIGTPTASVSNEVAAVQRLMKASGLSYSMHSAGTTVGMALDLDIP